MEVRTQEEFDRAKNFSREVRSDTWLGGSDRHEEGVWRWESNGELINMTMFWGRSQPDDSRNQDCLYMHVLSGLFADWSCSYFPEPFLCEFD